MNFIFYGLIGLGVILLLADANGFLVVRAEWVRWLRIIGLSAATVVGVAPIVWLFTSEWLSWYPPIVIGYLLLYVGFVIGTLGLAGPRWSTTLQRVAYGGLLLLVAIPPTVLLALAPALAIAGAALVRPDEREAERVTEFNRQPCALSRPTRRDSDADRRNRAQCRRRPGG